MELLPELLSVNRPLKISGEEFPEVKRPEPVLFNVAVDANVFPPDPVLSLLPFLVRVVVLLNVVPLRNN